MFLEKIVVKMESECYGYMGSQEIIHLFSMMKTTVESSPAIVKNQIDYQDSMYRMQKVALIRLTYLIFYDCRTGFDGCLHHGKQMDDLLASHNRSIHFPFLLQFFTETSFFKKENHEKNVKKT